MGGSVSQFAGMGRATGAVQAHVPVIQVDTSPLVQGKAAATLSQSAHNHQSIVIKETDDDDGT